MNELFESLKQNQFFAGFAGAGFMGAMTYLLKEVPNWLLKKFISHCTVSLTINSTSKEFVAVASEIARTVKFHSVNISKGGYDREGDAYSTGTPTGTRISKIDGLGWCQVHGYSTEAKTGDYPQVNFISISKLGRNIQQLNDFVGILSSRYQTNAKKENLIVSKPTDFGTENIALVSKRSLETVDISPNIKSRLMNIISDFLKNPDNWRLRGIPHRIGICLHGSPGNAKSSLVKALASEFGLEVLILDLFSVRSEQLAGIFRQAKGKMVVIEDIDAHPSVKKRAKKKVGAEVTVELKENGRFGEVNLSSILNALDGMMAQEGYVLVITTNHIDTIDPAVLRPGRIDYSFEIKNPEPEQVASMARRLIGLDAAEGYAKMAKEKSRSGAEWQGMMLEELSRDPVWAEFQNGLKEVKKKWS